MKMKNVIVILLVAMVPFFTMAQKRTKENANVSNTGSAKQSGTAYMVIKGIEIPDNRGELNNAEEAAANSIDKQELAIKNALSPNGKLVVSYDLGGTYPDDASNLMKTASKHRTMASALNAAAVLGWHFESANVLILNGYTTHFYYLKK